MKLHDLSWEVRDSALELLLVCTEISYVSEYKSSSQQPLALRVKSGFAMDHTGRLVSMKLRDLCWEVWDSALELLLVCTEISYVSGILDSF